MAQVIAPTIVRFTVHQLIGGVHRDYNNVDISLDTTFVATREDGVLKLASKFSALWQERRIKDATTTIEYLGAHYVDLHSADGITGDIGPAAGHPTVGSDSAITATPQVALLLHLSSGSRRGERQGRLYLSPVTEASVNGNGQMDASYRDAWASKLNNFRTDISALDSETEIESAAWRTVHVDKHDSPDSENWTWSSSTINTVSADPQCATQRRRNR